MPSVTPRSFRITHPTTGARVEITPWVNPTGSAWLAAQRVWVGDAAGVWQIAWANAASTNPTGVTIAYATAPTRITVSWTLPVPRLTDSYNVYRPDGSFVGSATALATSLVDQDPRPLNGAYSVKGVLSGIENSVGASSNTLDLRLVPATFTATYNVGTTYVDFAGTANALGHADSYNYYRVDGSFIGSTTGGIGGGDTFPGGAYRGTAQTYTVKAALSGIEAATGRTDTENVPPQIPQVQGISVLNNSGGVRTVYFGPANNVYTDFHIQTWQNGVWTDRGYSPTTNGQAAGTYDFTAANTGSLQVYTRVATRAPGGESDWAQLGPVTAIFDVAAPADVNWHSFIPEASYGRMVMRAQCPADADLVYAQIERYVPAIEAGYVVVWASGVGPGQELILDCGTLAAGQTMFCRVYLQDSHGNNRYSTVRSYTAVASPINIVPTSTNYWQAGVYNGDATTRPRQGTGPDRMGMWYYGTQITDVLLAHQVYQAQVVMVQLSGASGITGLMAHNQATNPGSGAGPAPGITAEFDWVNHGVGTFQYFLTADMLNVLAFGGYRGIGVHRAAGPTKTFANMSDNGFSGVLILDHLG